MPEYNIRLLWDADASVWVATSDDIPGFVLESGSLDALTERVRNAVPELLALNDDTSPDALLCPRSERRERVFA